MTKELSMSRKNHMVISAAVIAFGIALAVAAGIYVGNCPWCSFF